MRIISGIYRGRSLKLPKGVKMRFTSQKVKAALFNILAEKVADASFLELFAGSGGVGIEAKSRGAKVVCFVEKNPICLRAIAANLTHLQIPFHYERKNSPATKQAEVSVLPYDSAAALGILEQKGSKFDLVFLDPPYYRDRAKNCLINTALYDILSPRAYVIAEYNQGQILPSRLPGLRLKLAKQYGDTVLSIYQKGML